jgi:hypothetical protein
MKRAIACAAAVAALAIPAGAEAATTYTGKIKGDPKTSVQLKVAGKGNNRAVKSFKVEQLLINCEGGQRARLGSAAISGDAEVSDSGRFAIEGASNGQEVVLKGKLRGKRRARGTFKYSGPTLVGEQTRECASGKAGWRATR